MNKMPNETVNRIPSKTMHPVTEIKNWKGLIALPHKSHPGAFTYMNAPFS